MLESTSDVKNGRCDSQQDISRWMVIKIKTHGSTRDEGALGHSLTHRHGRSAT